MATRASPRVSHRQDVGFKAVISGTQTAAQNTATKINFTIEQYDYGNNFASSTFTAPVKGLYAFVASCCVLLDTSQNPDIGAFFYHNGVQRSRGYNGKMAYPNATCTDFLELNAGDTVDYRVLSRVSAAGIEDSNISGYFAGYLVREVA